MREHFVTPKKLFSEPENTLGESEQKREKSRFSMSLKTIPFAHFSLEMLCLSEL